MTFAKFAFTVAVAVLYVFWGWGMWTVWQALPWWHFLAALTLYLPPATWLLFLAGMSVIRADKQAHALPELAAYIKNLLLPMAAIHNAANNVLPMSIVFLDLPQELTTTKRLNRYVGGPDGLRKSRALAMREQLLNVFDYRGVHT